MLEQAVLLASGAIAMGYLVAGIFFLRFWTRTGDFLFLGFAVAFCLLAADQCVLGFAGDQRNMGTHYLVRMLRIGAFGLIILSVVRKNWPRRD